jgi:hypothetical protein
MTTMELPNPISVRVETDDFLGSLVARVLSDTEQARAQHPDRRPTWAPPLSFAPELIAVIEEARALWPKERIGAPDYGRLWAEWDSPRWFKKQIRFAGLTLRAGKNANAFTVVKIREGVTRPLGRCPIHAAVCHHALGKTRSEAAESTREVFACVPW